MPSWTPEINQTNGLLIEHFLSLKSALLSKNYHIMCDKWITQII